MASISDRWRNELNSLSQKDYITLTKAILFDLPEPQITSENQYVADKIYAGLKKTEYNRIAKQKAKAKRLNSNGIQIEFNRNSIGIQSEFKLNSIQEEKREAPPPCPPSSFPPHPPNITPYNPPPEEKREESPPDTGAGACVKGGVRSRRDRFEELWKLYPKKAGKANAFADYERAVKDGVTDEEIRDGINRYCEYIRAGQLTDRYILNGSTYFHQRRWQDVYNPPDNGRGGMSQEDWEEMNAVFG